ncbi:Fusaric acid resistance protein family protein [Aquimixticola soesokkakensis]|uniref:Fusaric acid resistance protein family protein n=1 Tax=Aquimixticola soesokkakensis TaxID=1519096 RepID=A0A1Y5TEZ1_9RHOB|nr:FUSC family protein [Aquimixticola soesokkakensis]SLN62697.1 Fusaric acid resistance protein family protein [Aquimixticola soesokkakensis]
MTQEVVRTALKLFAAAAVALSVAMTLGLEHAYWAGIPIWVIAQRQGSDLLNRSLMRIVGTLVGAGIGLALLSQVQDPVALSLAAGGLCALCVIAAQRLPAHRSYGATVSAITLVVIILPYLAGPPSPLAHAVDRVIATLIGVLCISVVMYRPKAQIPPSTQSAPGTQAVVGVRPLRGALVRGAVMFAAATGSALVLVALPSQPVMVAGMGLAILTALGASMHDPGPFLRGVVPGTVIGVLVAWGFSALIWYAAPGPLLFGGVLGAILLAGSFLRAAPRTAGIAIDANIGFLLVAQLGLDRDIVASAGPSGAALIGAAVIVRLVLGRVAR